MYATYTQKRTQHNYDTAANINGVLCWTSNWNAFFLLDKVQTHTLKIRIIYDHISVDRSSRPMQPWKWKKKQKEKHRVPNENNNNNSINKRKEQNKQIHGNNGTFR